MCVPALGMVAGLASSMVSGMGAMAAGDAEAQRAEYNAKVEKINARTERQKGLVEQEKITQKYDQKQSSATAAAGASGVDPGYGSAALVIFGEGGQYRSADMGTAYINAESAATAHENKAKDYEMDAQAKRQAGQFAAAGSFLSGLGGAVKSAGGSGGMFSING